MAKVKPVETTGLNHCLNQGMFKPVKINEGTPVAGIIKIQAGLFPTQFMGIILFQCRFSGEKDFIKITPYSGFLELIISVKP